MNGLVHWTLKKAIKKYLKDKKNACYIYSHMNKSKNKEKWKRNFFDTKFSFNIEALWGYWFVIFISTWKERFKKTASHLHSFIKWKCYKC